jgi:biopolymer transport protein ExbD
MRQMYFKPLTEEERKKNEHLDEMNHAPYFKIFFIISIIFLAFTTLVLVGVF